ncbi:hypothetical protein BO70DRAFT_194487 [Aspergillus heteromorphus CBS 117.55]|uniref:Uncharacterized protein n=1 Tax=Aspergillus heteromorphus CBS 117.55 TaxID=1448321 RepID=A0A317WP01_9EURO|nr:uncharacterized protein BO70DRAFT_194487 [Aspergillus heteromorphus CBS 117.55]PWY87441.1 hypothetical protein BO70DRAFT_194487 [Aspergillus heteromorphus CBS 117.55]
MMISPFSRLEYPGKTQAFGSYRQAHLHLGPSIIMPPRRWTIQIIAKIKYPQLRGRYHDPRSSRDKKAAWKMIQLGRSDREEIEGEEAVKEKSSAKRGSHHHALNQTGRPPPPSLFFLLTERCSATVIILLVSYASKRSTRLGFPTHCQGYLGH